MEKSLDKQLEFDFMKEERRAKKVKEVKEYLPIAALYIASGAAIIYAFDNLVVPLLNSGLEYLAR